MNKQEKVYKFLVSRGIVTVDELTRFAKEVLDADYPYLYKQYLHKFLKTGKVKRVRRGMYAAINIYDPNPSTHDRYLIASKIRERYYSGYHTALELHGCAYSAFMQCQIGVERNDAFRPFRFQGISYQPVIQHDVNLEIDEMTRDGDVIRVSSASRTFVECIRRLDLVGGLEECYKSLDGLGGVSLTKVNLVLDYYKSDILIRAAGFFLDQLRERSPYYGHITVSALDALTRRIGSAPMYIVKNMPSTLNKRWNLYIPIDFDDIVRGV